MRFGVYVETQGEVIIIWPEDSTEGARVRIDKLKGSKGTRFWFVCWETGRRVETLLVSDLQIGTRYTFGYDIVAQKRSNGDEEPNALEILEARLTGADGRFPAWGVERRRLLRLRDGGDEDEGTPSGEDAPDGLGQCVDHALLPVGKARQSPEIAMQAVELRLPEAAHLHEPTSGDLQSRVLQASYASVCDYPELSVDALAKGWANDDGRDMKLVWAAAGLEVVASRLQTRQPAHALLLISSSAEAATWTQIVQLTLGRQRCPKTYAVCPVTGALVSRLYFRQRRFVSAEAQRLRPPSKSPLYRPAR